MAGRLSDLAVGPVPGESTGYSHCTNDAAKPHPKITGASTSQLNFPKHASVFSVDCGFLICTHQEPLASTSTRTEKQRVLVTPWLSTYVLGFGRSVTTAELHFIVQTYREHSIKYVASAWLRNSKPRVYTPVRIIVSWLDGRIAHVIVDGSVAGLQLVRSMRGIPLVWHLPVRMRPGSGDCAYGAGPWPLYAQAYLERKWAATGARV